MEDTKKGDAFIASVFTEVDPWSPRPQRSEEMSGKVEERKTSPWLNWVNRLTIINPWALRGWTHQC